MEGIKLSGRGWTPKLHWAGMGRSLISIVVTVLAAVGSGHAQWQMQVSRTTANLRGIHAVNSNVAWASGAQGTVLRTEDGGSQWTKCTVPAGAEKLDFRGVWAWDANTAIVMSSGPGEQSRLYKTVDGCRHWSEEARNTEKDGFWDAVVFDPEDFGTAGAGKTGVLLGDPLRGLFDTHLMLTSHGWAVETAPCAAREGEAAFAASNSSVFVFGPRRYIIVTGGKLGARALLSPLLAGNNTAKACQEIPLPLDGGADSTGAFSVAFRDPKHGVVVGGDYKKPDDPSGTAAWTSDGGLHWTAASQPPRGYRSAVAWDTEAEVWIAAGTSGSDMSRDDGKTWKSLEDGNWNALSLPYVVGPGGRIGKVLSASGALPLSH